MGIEDNLRANNYPILADMKVVETNLLQSKERKKDTMQPLLNIKSSALLIYKGTYLAYKWWTISIIAKGRLKR